ncbi:MAG TPA: MFS transporter [Symbiobacteriaceae bacterium]|nr:MFS transporter [Symbiobacteriaceae bacterium]
MHAFRDTFVPLRNQNLRLYLGGQAISLIGTMMQTTAQAWVVWQLTSSSAALGIVAMLGSLPLLIFGAVGGVWADRLNRRRVLVVTQAVAMGLAFLFAYLLHSGLIQLWHICVLAFALGCVAALDYPAQTAFIADLTGVQFVRQATVVNQMLHQIARMAGPAMAGWIMGSLGVAPAFWINGASFLAVIGSLLLVRSGQATGRSGRHGSGGLQEGFRFIGTAPRIQDLLLFSLTLTFFVFTIAQLMPVIVTDSLHAGPDALGLIMGASGLGALCGSLAVVPAVQRIKRVGWALAGAGIWTGLAMGAVRG